MGSFISMPSIKTRVCSDLAPRINTEVCPPGPPDRTTSRAGTVRRISGTVVFCLCSICWLVMTVIELPTSLDAVSILVAVTTTSSVFSSFPFFSLLSDCFVVSGTSVNSDSWAATILGTTNSNASNTIAIMDSLLIFYPFSSPDPEHYLLWLLVVQSTKKSPDLTSRPGDTVFHPRL